MLELLIRAHSQTNMKRGIEKLAARTGAIKRQRIAGDTEKRKANHGERYLLAKGAQQKVCPDLSH
jgi:hypothetical protein